jgi:hypothetical protein
VSDTPTHRFSGVTVILSATIAAGVAAYVVIWLIPRSIGFEAYAEFAVFWAALYLLVGTLSGIQQEIARATTIVATPSLPVANRARVFGLSAIVIVGVLVPISAVFWASFVFPTFGWALVAPVAVGTAGYVAIAVMSGTLFGLHRWGWVAIFIAADAAMRVVLVALVLLVSDDVVLIAWAVVAPFPLVMAALWPFARRHVVGRAQLDVGFRALASNVSHTIAGAASTAVMVSGFPLFIGVTSRGASAAEVGMAILAVTLVRAPLIVPAMSLQSFLVVRFREGAIAGVALTRVIVLLLGVGAVFAAAGALVGPALFAWLFPGEIVPQPLFIAALVGSSLLVAGLFVTGSAVLARGAHGAYVVGWALAAAGTVALLLVPGELLDRIVVSVVVAPVLGIIVHLVALARGSRRTP